MAVKIRKGGALASLSLTPLIDVVFLLLIFFLVATRFAEEENELPLSLPSASQARALTERPQQMVVVIDKQGRYSVGGQAVDANQLDAIIGQAAVNNPGRQTVRIQGDKQSPLERTVYVFDLCLKYGIPHYGVGVEPARE